MIKSKYLGALVFFLVLVLALSVSAAEDFEVTVKSEAIDICKCVQGETSFKVKNTGDMVSFYYIELEGPAAEWVTILESEFMLEPLDEKTITMMVNVPCSGKSNNELLIHVITELNTATTVKQNLKLKTCSNSIVTTTTPKIINCPAATSTFAFTIENTASY